MGHVVSAAMPPSLTRLALAFLLALSALLSAAAPGLATADGAAVAADAAATAGDGAARLHHRRNGARPLPGRTWR